MMETVEAQPETALPHNATMTDQIIPIRLTAATNKPNPVMIRMGLTERLVMPSKANASIFLSG